MKLLLLSVNSFSFFYSQVVIPFGLACLGSYVQDDGHIIKGIEMNTPPEKIPQRYLRVDKQLLEEIKEYDPDLVAMSTYATNIHNVLFWSETIKKVLPTTTIALGGNHASYLASEIIKKSPAVDIIIRFEGEIPFKQLCNKIEKSDRNYEDIPNITYRKNGKICENSLTGLIEDLDNLPLLNRTIFEPKEIANPSHADIITARGCPFHCTFCNCNHYWRKRYRAVSNPRIIEDLIMLKTQHPALKTVRIRDESISINRKRCVELCQILAKNKLGLKFQAHSRLDGLDEEVIKNLSMAGFNQLFIGIESGSQAVLNRLRKGIEITKVHEIVPLLRKYNISFRLSLMLATPDETADELLQTLHLINELGLDFDEFYFGIGIEIYPGTSDSIKFLERFPKYKWLERRKIGGSYSQEYDKKGNPISVKCLSPKYSLDELYGKINETLQTRLLRYNEMDYGNFRAARQFVEKVSSTTDDKQLFDNNLSEFLKRLDNTGKKWAIYRKGIYYSKFFSNIIEKNEYTNFSGILSPQDLDEIKRLEIKKKFQGIEYLLMTVVKSEACNFNAKAIFGPQVKTFLAEELLNQNVFYDNEYVEIDEVLGKISTDKHFTLFKIKRILKMIKLYSIANNIVKRYKHLFRYIPYLKKFI